MNESAIQNANNNLPLQNEAATSALFLCLPEYHAEVERPYLFQEFLPQQPYKVLQQIFTGRSRCDQIKDLLCLWIRDLFGTDHGSENPCQQRQALKEFYNDLFLLIEVLYSAKEQHEKSGATSSVQSPPANGCIPISGTDIIDNPLLVVRDFCHQYHWVYVRRELYCCLHAAVEYAVANPKDCTVGEAIDWYQKVLTLVETAYLLTGSKEA